MINKQNENVWEATQKRIAWIFNNYNNIYVAFSGGKDSGIVLNMVLEYEKIHKTGVKLSLYYLDCEAQYSKTIEYIEAVEKELENVELYHCCLPVKTQCAVNQSQGYWSPWSLEDEDIWVREMPKNAINELNKPWHFSSENLTDYQFHKRFGCWMAENEKTACLIGLRAEESLSRHSIFTSERRKNLVENLYWSTRINDNLSYFYPIYDWTVEDIWIAYSRTGWLYNKIYDLFYQAGLSVSQMRVASPFNNAAIGTLALYKALDPNMWGKMVSRVNGVNYAGIYGGTTAMGWRKIKLPKGHTWKSYLKFLLKTLDHDTRQNFLAKFHTSVKFWTKKGGALDNSIIEDLHQCDIEFEVKGKISNQSTKNVVVFKDYPDDICIKDFKAVPSYKRMCICILKNDWSCKYMGFAPTKIQQKIKKAAINKYGKRKL